MSTPKKPKVNNVIDQAQRDEALRRAQDTAIARFRMLVRAAQRVAEGSSTLTAWGAILGQAAAEPSIAEALFWINHGDDFLNLEHSSDAEFAISDLLQLAKSVLRFSCPDHFSTWERQAVTDGTKLGDFIEELRRSGQVVPE